MKKIFFFYIFFFVSFLNGALAQELTAEKIYENTNDAVVTIYTFDANNNPLSQGSGVVLNDKGWIATNYHVYAGADKIIVKHKNKIVEYTGIIGLDVEKDILILKIANRTFPHIYIGNSNLLKIGQKIYAIGSPMGLENTITEGIISGLRSNSETSKHFIQISAAISHGSSGGAVLDTKGRLIGISTSTVIDGQNLNFAIPINEVLKIYKQSDINPKALAAANFFYKGLAAENENNFDAAINNYKRAIEIYPEYAMPYANLGNVYNNRGEFETALAYYKKVLELNPKFTEVYINIGNVYYGMKDFETALSYYRKASVLNPTSAKAYTSLGNVYNEKKDYESAITYFKKAITLDPGSSETYYNLGNAYYNKGELGTAINYYQKAININPKNVTAYMNIGNAYSLKHEFDIAITYYKQAINIDPNFARAYYNLGLTYGFKGEDEMKQYYLQKADELNPSLKSR